MCVRVCAYVSVHVCVYAGGWVRSRECMRVCMHAITGVHAYKQVRACMRAYSL